MIDTVVGRGHRGRNARALALWVLGASAVGSVVPNVLLAVFAGCAMTAISTLDLTRAPGVGVYLAACVVCMVAYWAMLHGAMLAMRRCTEVPSIVWPALLVWSAIWVAVSVFMDPRGVLEPASAVLGATGVLLAWVMSGRSHPRGSRSTHA